MLNLEIYRTAASNLAAALGLTDEEKARSNKLGSEGAVEREKKAAFLAAMGGLARRVIWLAASATDFPEGEWIDEAATKAAIVKLHDIVAINEMEFIFEYGRLNSHSGVIHTDMTSERRAIIQKYEDEL